MINTATKQCPLCAETIKAQARLCRFCGARFEVLQRGYCPNCHGVVEVKAAARCLTCGGEVVDVHLESRLIQAEPTAQPPQAAPARPFPSPDQKLPRLPPAAAGPVKKKRSALAWVILVLLLCVGAGALTNRALQGRPEPTRAASQSTGVTSTPPAEAGLSATEMPQPTRTAPATPASTPTIALHPGDNPGTACFTTRGGFTCLDSLGWFAFPRHDPALQEELPGVETCASEKLSLLPMGRAGMCSNRGKTSWALTWTARASYGFRTQKGYCNIMGIPGRSMPF